MESMKEQNFQRNALKSMSRLLGFLKELLPIMRGRKGFKMLWYVLVGNV